MPTTSTGIRHSEGENERGRRMRRRGKDSVGGENLARIEEIQGLIGARIKRARKSRGLTIQNVAKQSGLTAGYISQIENNKALPSVAAIFKIGNVLDCPITFFFERDEAAHRCIVRKGQRKTLSFPVSKIVFELLSPDLLGKRLDPNIMRIEKGGRTGATPYRHKTGEVVILVLKGAVHLRLGNTGWRLDEGDSAHFDATKPHTIANAAPRTTELLWVATPPAY
jgi:transcriptional regulator with XRE-family HTH domain